MSLPMGTTVDKYSLVRLIGKGAMGAVYEARHTLVGKRCALKMLLNKFAGDQEVIRRMLREAQAAASIGHPNIVDTFDFGTTSDGSCYLVMEYLEGQSLGALIEERGVLKIEQVVDITSQVLSGLEAAHAKGIVHRDLKPDNIFIAKSLRGGDEVKLLDFGISKFLAAPSEDTKLTRVGSLLGTPYYMSPEQAESARNVDHRTDLWSVGVILYESLTGEMPFYGQTYNQIILKLVTKDPAPPKALRPDMPEAMEKVILKALEKDPKKRWATAEELREALLASTSVEPSSSAAPPSSVVPLSSAAGIGRTIRGSPWRSGPSEKALSDKDMEPRNHLFGEGKEGSCQALDIYENRAAQGPKARASSGVQTSPANREPSARARSVSFFDDATTRYASPGCATAPTTGMKIDQEQGRQTRPGRRWLVGGAVVMAGLAAIVLLLILSIGGRRKKSASADHASKEQPRATADLGSRPDASDGLQVKGLKSGVDGGAGDQSGDHARGSGRGAAVKVGPAYPRLSVKLMGLPPGAKVKLDGKPARPPLVLRADGKLHSLEVAARGYQNLKVSFVASKGLRKLNLRPRRRYGSMSRTMSSTMSRPRFDPLSDPYRKGSGR